MGLVMREVFVAGPEPASPGIPQPSATKLPPDATREELKLKREWSDKERWRLKKPCSHLLRRGQSGPA